MHKNIKRFLGMAAGGLLGVTLSGSGQYLITGYTDVEYWIRFMVFWLIGGSIGFLIARKMLDL